MTVSSERLRSLAVTTVASFGATAPAAGAAAGWSFANALENVPMPGLIVDRDKGREVNAYGLKTADFFTRYGATHSFDTRLHSGFAGCDGGLAGGDTDPTVTYLGRLWDSLFGMTGTQFSGSTVSGGSTTSPTLASTTGLHIGHALGICNTAVGSTTPSDMQFRVAIGAESAYGTLTLDEAITAATNGFVVYGCRNWKPTIGEYGTYLYLNDAMDGHGRLLGPARVASVDITGFTGADGLRCKWNIIGDSWTDGVTPSAAETDNSYNHNLFNTPFQGTNGQIMINSIQTRVAQMDLKIAPTVTPIVVTGDSTSTGAPNGRAGYMISDPGTFSGKITEYYLAARWTQFRGRTVIPLRIAYALGTTNAERGRAFVVFYIPQAQVDLKEVRIEGQVAQEFTFEAIAPTAAQQDNGLTSPYYFGLSAGINSTLHG